jgi:hypothetical protein
MRLRLDINGYMEGYNSHMSLFLDHVQGENALDSPFDVEAQFTLLNMNESENYTRTEQLRFKQPTAAGSTFAGLKQFIGHNVVPKFVMKDTDSIFIKFEVKSLL